MFDSIIFDWSGTLCDDLTLTLQATNHVIGQYGLPPLDRKSFREEFQLPYPNYYSWKTPGIPIEELEAHYRNMLNSPEAVPVAVIPYAREFLEFCRARGIRCFILSSMDTTAFNRQVREQGLYSFFEAFHTGILNKKEYIHELIARHDLDVQKTAFIGDMQHDMLAAHSAGVCAIGVLTGYNNAAQLHEAQPDLVVPHLGALQALMQRCPSRLPRDSVRLHALAFTCRLGVSDEERATPQPVRAEVSFVPPRPFSEMHDSLARTIDYDALSRRLIALAQGEPTCLLETLAHKFAACCVREFGALEATATLRKYALPNTESVSARAHAGAVLKK